MQSRQSRRAASQAFRNEARAADSVTFWDWLHGVIYLRRPYFYIGTATGEHPLAKMLIPLYSFLSRLLILHRAPHRGEPLEARRLMESASI
ncbi:MAG TPA: hypothetical protein ENN03_06580 [bacterium]|nr:hypothetical protein [bacterium]